MFRSFFVHAAGGGCFDHRPVVQHGIVKTEENRQLAIERVQKFFEENLKEKYGGTSGGLIESPIKGTHGNIEYLWHVKIKKPAC